MCVGGTEGIQHRTLENFEKDGTPHRNVENILKNKFVLGSVRNPWDWYISLWAFGCSQKGGLYDRLTNKQLLRAIKNILKHFDFFEMRKLFTNWKELYRDSENPDLFRKWIRKLYDRNLTSQLDEGYACHSTSKFAGFMTYRYGYFFLKNFTSDQGKRLDSFEELEEFDRKNNILDGIIIMDNLENDFLREIASAGYKVNEDMIKIVNDFGKKKSNTSNHQHTSFYYDEETMNLVAENEKLIIKKYGFEFPR